MKVLLLNAPFEFEGASIQGAKAGARWAHRSPKGFIPFPFFLAYAAAVLKGNNYRVNVIDAIAEGLDGREFLNRITGYRPDVVFMECSTPSIDVDLKFLKMIKEQTQAYTILAGSHATICAESILGENRFVDFILKNEYDFTLKELVGGLENGLNPAEIKGLCWRENGGVICSRENPYVEDLDRLPFPARELFPMSCYNEALCERPNVSIMSSRGCPYNCIFCLWPQTFYGTRRYRFRTSSLVVDEIEILLRDYRPREIYFDDDTFTVNRERVMELSREIKRRGLCFKWDCLGHIGNMDEEMLYAMKDAGCNRIRYGVESGNSMILENINKSTTPDRIREVFCLTKQVGILRHATVTFGLPGETKETLQETIRFILELNPDTVQFSIAVPFPGTRFFKMAEERGWLKTKDWSKFDGHSFSVLDMEGVKAEDIAYAYTSANAVWAVHRRRRGDNPWWRNLFEFARHPLRAIRFLRYYLKYR